MRIVVVVVALLVAASGCRDNNATDKPAEVRPPSQTVAPPPLPSFGVSACDDYARQFAACLDELPTHSRAAAEQAWAVTARAWPKRATEVSDVSSKAAFAQTCTDAAAALTSQFPDCAPKSP